MAAAEVVSLMSSEGGVRAQLVASQKWDALLFLLDRSTSQRVRGKQGETVYYYLLVSSFLFRLD